MQPKMVLLNLYNQGKRQEQKSRKVIPMKSHNPTQSPNLSQFSDLEDIN